MSKRRLTSRDLLEFAFLSDPQISPDGARIAYTHTTIDKESNEYRSRIYLVPAAGGEARPFTGGPKRDSGARWSPEGSRIVFVSDRSGSNQLWLMPSDGGEARQLTRIKGGVSGAGTFSPDGKKVLFLAKVGPKGAEEDKKDPEETDLYEKYNKDVKHITRIWYKLESVGFFDEKRTHIFTVDVETGELAQLTQGEHDFESPVWSPDGSLIAFAANLREDADYHFLRDIYVMPAAGGEPRRLTPGTGYFEAPRFSPDGRTIAFVGHYKPHGYYSNTRVYTVPVDGGEVRQLHPEVAANFQDHSITDMRTHGSSAAPAWSADGKTVYISGSYGGNTYIYAIPAAGGEPVAVVTGERVVYGYSLAPAANRLALAISDVFSPGDIYVADLSRPAPASAGDTLRVSPGTSHRPVETVRLTRANQALLDQFELVRPERFTFRADGGPEIDAWAMKPIGYEKGKKSAAVLKVHGGPMSMYANAFFFQFQLWAHHGYGVIYSNPRGSTGYGEDFCASIRGEWGDKDYADVMALLDAGLAQGWIDERRVGISGGSYGGFMANWVVSHTNRFAAAITDRSVVNEYTMFGCSDFGYFDDEDFDGALPWTDPMRYLRVSPIHYVGNVETPLLIVHSEQDYRCPIEQAEQLYAALKKQRKTVEFLRFPEESHELSRGGKPWHRVFRLDKMLEWFGRHIS